MTIDYATAIFIANAIIAVGWVGFVAVAAWCVGRIHRRLTRRACRGCGESVKRCICEDWK